MALRILSCALFTLTPLIISLLVKLLYAIEVPLCVISVFKCSVANFDKRLSSTIFLLVFKFPSSFKDCALFADWDTSTTQFQTVGFRNFVR